jgi:hypothetical protein
MKNKKRQYRSNQGRSPKEESTTFKVLDFTFRIMIVSVILGSIIYILGQL